MNRNATLIIFSIIAFAVVFVASGKIFAQDADTLDVPQGFETLNLAVEADTAADGSPKNLNRVYRLERGGFYLLNGSVRDVGGAPLRIVAAKGAGPMPVLIPAVDATGEADRAFRPGGDGTWIGLYVTGIDNLGNGATKNMFRLDGKGVRIIIDNCFLDYDLQSFVRMNAPEQKLYVTNTIARNSSDIADPGNGRIFDTRANTQDTLFVQNCTFYVNTGNVVRTQGGIVKNFIWDHVTVYQGWEEIDFGGHINGKIINSLFVDWGVEGDVLSSDPGDSLRTELITMDTLGVGGLVPDDQRNIRITDNVIAYTPELANWINSIDSLDFQVLFNAAGQRIIDMFPNMVVENNIDEYPVFSDAPDPATAIAFAQHRLETNFSDEGNPEPFADRNGRGDLTTNPETAGPNLADEYDFDYSTSSAAYTHAQGGFPVGDLNWFPQKKSEWEDFMSSVDDENELAMPTRFRVEQNYPNPFNPSTTIVYQLNTPATVKLTVYNVIGQKIRTLVKDQRQKAGEYSVQWDGRDDTGRMVASGLYMYRLESDKQVQTKKMLLLK